MACGGASTCQQVQAVDFTSVAVNGGTADRGETEGTEERAGSFIAVRDEEAIDPQNAIPGRTFAATILEDICDANGNIVIPGGSPAAVMVRPVAEGGEPGYVIELAAVTIDGNRYSVYGGAIAAGPRKTGQEDAAVGDGDAGQVKVSGARLRVPAQTVLEFRLEQPLLLRQIAQ